MSKVRELLKGIWHDLKDYFDMQHEKRWTDAVYVALLVILTLVVFAFGLLLAPLSAGGL